MLDPTLIPAQNGNVGLYEGELSSHIAIYDNTNNTYEIMIAFSTLKLSVGNP